MKYLCLVYSEKQKFEALSPAEQQALAKSTYPRIMELQQSGQLLAGAGLGRSSDVVCIRPRRGQPAVTDGPFVETKEQVGGFFIIEARDMNDAIRVASLHPAAHVEDELRWGLEIHPIVHFSADELKRQLDTQGAKA